MDDPDPVFISECELVHADDIFGVVILDIHQIAGFPFGIFQELAANLNIDFFSASLADKIDFFDTIFPDIDRVSSSSHFEIDDIFQHGSDHALPEPRTAVAERDIGTVCRIFRRTVFVCRRRGGGVKMRQETK